MEESVLPSTTLATVPSSFSSTVTSNLPVRPSALTVGVPSLVSSTAGAKLLTAAMTALLLMVAPDTVSIPLTGSALPTNWARNASSSFARKLSSIEESVLPIFTEATVPSSFSSTVTSNLPVRPSALTVGAPSLVSSTAGAKLLTAAMTALLLMVAPDTVSIPLTGSALPTNWARNASSSFARKLSSISLSVLPSTTLATVPSSFSSTVTGNLPVRPSALTVLPVS